MWFLRKGKQIQSPFVFGDYKKEEKEDQKRFNNVDILVH